MGFQKQNMAKDTIYATDYVQSIQNKPQYNHNYKYIIHLSVQHEATKVKPVTCFN